MIRTARAGLTRFLLCLLPVLGVWLLAPDRAWPQSVANSFKGKEIRILVGYSAGGGYDIYARTVARYLGNHIPGNPTVIVQNMPGADGLKLANYLYVQAPKDGTVIALTNRNVAVAPHPGPGRRRKREIRRAEILLDRQSEFGSQRGSIPQRCRGEFGRGLETKTYDRRVDRADREQCSIPLRDE